MKILHTVNDLNEKSGGVATCTYSLLKELVRDKCNISLLTHQSKYQSIHNEEDWIISLRDDGYTPIRISNNFKRYLRKGDFDIYHTNGMWLYINHITCSIARQKRKPYIITPHGMLYPEALDRSKWKKLPMRKIWFDRDILNASCIHATCDKEMENIRLLGYKGPIAVIGNPVSAPDYIEELYAAQQKNSVPFRSIAFLGRLHPRKKVENILRGASLSAHKDIDIYITGKGNSTYEEFLKEETRRLGLNEQVHFLGFLTGKEKYARLAMTDALFVPSDMENFGMIIPEALIVGTPVMASLGTPWKVLNTEHCGWWRDNSPESIAAVINELYSMTDEERLIMGTRGRDYILRTYASEIVAKQMLELYKWIAGESGKPEFVYD